MELLSQVDRTFATRKTKECLGHAAYCPVDLCSNDFKTSVNLQLQRNKADNGAVRTRLSITALAAAVLCLPLMLRPLGARAPKAPPPEARVDINRASLDELLKVPGMTRSWAGRIVRFRPYRAKTDLLEHGVVTSEVYERIKNYVIAHREKE